MREVLFRGKRTDNGEWAYGSPIFQDGYVLIRFWNGEEIEFEEYLVSPETIGQYIGSTDKNGKKIFEGDIIAWNDGETDTNGFCCDDELFSIEFSCKEVAFVANYEAYREERLDGLDTSYTTVIGNIHDNPKLLKGGADND